MLDEQIRIASFHWLEERSLYYDDVIPRQILETGFIFKGNQISLVGPKGIWKPQSCQLPLSITTTSESPYNDSFTEENYLKYKYRGQDPFHPDNIGIRNLMKSETPLIYFHGIVKGKYLASWPVFIIKDDMHMLTFKVAQEESKQIFNSNIEDQSSYYRRSYLTSNIKVRLHQRAFRERILRAYHNQCTLCKLKHIELLDAAHIIADSEDQGDPIVPNGLALCKIHRAAFDKNIIGITPDYYIKVRNDVLEEIDGPMLRYGLQTLHNKLIELPSKRSDYPDKHRLEMRFERFKIA